MSTITKTLLILGLGNLVAGLVFVTGLVNPHDLVALYVTLPAGAIFFGLFLISRMLEKEAARYDQEQRTILARTSIAATPRSETEAHPIGHSAHSHAH